MVSIRYLYLNFIYIPNIKIHQSRNLTPVSLFPEITLKFNNFINSFKTTTNTIHNELVTDLLDLIEKSTNPNLNSILSQYELNYDERRNVLELLINNWNEKELGLALDKLFSLRRVIKGLNLDPLTVSESLNNVKINNENAERILLFNDLFGDANFSYSLQFSFPNINTLNTKIKILKTEFERLLDVDLKDHNIENPRYTPDLKNVPALLAQMKQQISEIFGDNSRLFRSVTDHDLVSLAISLSDLIWEYNYYKHRAKLRLSNDVIELLRVNKPFCEDIFSQLVDSRMNEIKLIKIPNIVDKPVYSHPLKIFPILYQQQFEHSLKDFYTWYNYSRGVLEELNTHTQNNIDSVNSENSINNVNSGNINPDNSINSINSVNSENSVNNGNSVEWIYARALEEIGGYRPYIKFVSEDSRNPLSREGFRRKYVQRAPDDLEDLTITPEDRKDFDKIEEDMKMFQHMSKDDLAKHFIRKFKSEYQYAKRLKSRFQTLKLIHRVTNDQITQFTDEFTKELDDITSKQDNTLNSINPVNTVNTVNSVLMDVKTCLNYHLMNVRHMAWHLECAAILPVECLYNIKKMGCTIINPKPRTLFFFSHNFLKAFNTIKEFVQSNNKYTSKHINTSNTNDHTVNTVNTINTISNSVKFVNSVKKPMLDRERLFFEAYNSSKRRIPEINEDTTIGDDPDYKLKDSEMLKAMVKSGAGLKISGSLPFGMQLENIDPADMSPQLEQSSLYRLTISQPEPSYRCKKCNYTVYGHEINISKGKTIGCYEFEQVRDDPNYKCRNCGNSRDGFEIVYRTAERHYELPPYIHFKSNPKFNNTNSS